LRGEGVQAVAWILREGTESCRVAFFDGSSLGLQSLLIFHVIDVSVHPFGVLKFFSTAFDLSLL
jgi:hypothetical protein